MANYSKKLNSGVYLITNVINKKVYVGSSCCLKGRKYRHFKDLKENKAEGYRGTMQNLSGGKSAMNESHKIIHVYRPEVFYDIIAKKPELKGKTFIYADKIRDGILGSTMPDIEMQMYNGILKQANEIRAMQEKMISGLKDFK